MTSIKLVLLLLLTGSALAHGPQTPPHLDLEMTSEEYAFHLRQLKRGNKNLDDPSINRALKLGERLSAWIATVNAERSQENAIRLTSPTTRTGIPIDKPNIYSPSLIDQRVKEVLREMPEEMKAILISLGKLPSTIPVEDEIFIKNARLLDRQYQSAARYKSLIQWRSHYINKAKSDVRGYHYLLSNKISSQDLEDINQIPADKLDAIKDALAKVCFNTPRYKPENCAYDLEEAVNSNSLAEFYNKHIKVSEKIWNDFFVIPEGVARRDVDWNGNVATVPFNTPDLPKFIPYLKDNIEDEFRWKDWGLKIKFGTFSHGPILIFRAGEVPHVDSLGGNQIVMDSNQPIEEYESQWTIRHEFGHVLGLPDCYHEFYDTKLEAFVNYQLDTTDLMCSRAGNMTERIYEELRKAYQP